MGFRFYEQEEKWEAKKWRLIKGKNMLTLERDCIFRERNKEGFGEYDQMRERQSECGVLKSKQLPLVFGFVFGLW